MNIPVAQGHISDGPSRYKLTRTSAKIFNQIENTPFSDNILLSVFKRYKIEFIKLRQKSM